MGERNTRTQVSRTQHVHAYIYIYIYVVHVCSVSHWRLRAKKRGARRAEPSRSRRRHARRRRRVARGESPGREQQSFAGLRAGMRWSRDARRDRQRSRPVTGSLAIIRRDIAPARVPLPWFDAYSPASTHARIADTLPRYSRFRIVSTCIESYRTLYWISRGMRSRAHLPGCISDLERVGCTVPM